MLIVALQIYLLPNTRLAILVMAASDTFVEAEVSHQGTKSHEPDIGSCPSVEDSLRQPLLPVHELVPSRQARVLWRRILGAGLA